MFLSQDSSPSLNCKLSRHLDTVSIPLSPCKYTTFLTGSDSLWVVFDISRPGQEPISWLRKTRAAHLPREVEECESGTVRVRAKVPRPCSHPAKRASVHPKSGIF